MDTGTWTVVQAKAKLSEVIENALTRGPQTRGPLSKSPPRARMTPIPLAAFVRRRLGSTARVHRPTRAVVRAYSIRQ